MKLARLLPASAACGFLLALSVPSHAYCLTHTCDPSKEQCEFVDGCNSSGKTLFWASSVVSWDVQKDDSLKAGISSLQLETVVSSAFARWQAVDCPGGGKPSITLLNKGRISCGKAEYNKSQPNANVITFHDATWPYSEEASIETLALTTVFFNGDTGEIYDANVEINTNESQFSLSGTDASAVDLNAVLTHELGHFLGLSHSAHFDATMYSSYMPDMTSLEADDAAAICASLPPGRAAKTSSSEPRHGFSGECGTPQDSGCGSTVAGSVPAHAQLGWWALGLGLCAWGARFKRRAARQ